MPSKTSELNKIFWALGPQSWPGSEPGGRDWAMVQAMSGPGYVGAGSGPGRYLSWHFSLNNVYVEGSSIFLLKDRHVGGQIQNRRLESVDPQSVVPQSVDPRVMVRQSVDPQRTGKGIA